MAEFLKDLQDVSVNAPAAGDQLIHSGSGWVNRPPTRRHAQMTAGATITPVAGAFNEITLSQAGHTLSLPIPAYAATEVTTILMLRQDATGGRTVTTWRTAPGVAFTWVGGGAPVLARAGGAWDLVVVNCRRNGSGASVPVATHAGSSVAGGPQPRSRLDAAVDPAAADDAGKGFAIGSRWVNTATDEEFVCLDAATGAAVWKSTTGAATGGGGAVSSVFGRAGAVAAAIGDYTASHVANDSDVAGASVCDALKTLGSGVQAVAGTAGRAIVAPANDNAAISLELPAAVDRRDFLLGFTASGAVTTTKVATVGGLDALAADGFKGIGTVANMAALRVRAGAAPEEIVYLRGYHTAGDGGEGFFRWDAASTAADNAGTLIKATSATGRWVRQFTGALNVKWFGIDDSGNTDVSAALNSIISYAYAALIRTLYIPAGDYRIENPLVLKCHLRIYGDYAQGNGKLTVIKPYRCPAFELNGAINGIGACHNNTIEHLAIWPLDPNGGSLPMCLINFKNHYSNRLINMRISGELANERVTASGAGNGYIVIDGGHDTQLQNIQIDCRRTQIGYPNDLTAVSISYGDVFISHCDIEDSYSAIRVAPGEQSADPKDAAYVHINQCYFERYAYGIDVVKATTGSPLQDPSVHAVNCFFGNAGDVHAIRLANGARNVSAHGCSFAISSGTVLAATSSSSGLCRFFGDVVTTASHPPVPLSHLHIHATAARCYQIDGFFWSDGSPEGQLTAAVGSLCINYRGGAGQTMFAKETGVSNIGWRAM